MWCACSGGERAPEVAQSLLADLRDAPQPRIRAAVRRQDVGPARPVEAAGVGDAAGQCVAVATDVLGEGIDDEPRADRLRAEQPGRGHRVVDDVEDAPRLAQRADAREVGDLRARVRDRLDEHDARLGPQRPLDLRRVRGVDVGDPRAVSFERLEQAVGVAEQEAARDDVVVRAEQREHRGGDRRHPGGEGDGRDALLHRTDLGLERRGGRVALPPVDVARLAALEHGCQVARVAVAVRDRDVQRLVQRAVLDRGAAVGMQDRGGEAARFAFGHCQVVRKQKTRRAAKPDGFRVPRPESPGWSGPRFSGICYAPAS